MNAYSAIMKKNKIDLGALTDQELEGLMSEMQRENVRRNKLGGVGATLLKSKWTITVVVLCIGLVVLFYGENSTMKDESSDVSLAKPGEKGAWLIEPAHKEVSKDEKVEAEPENEIPEETQEETVDETHEEEDTESESTGDVTEEDSAAEETTKKEENTGTETETTTEEENTETETETETKPAEPPKAHVTAEQPPADTIYPRFPWKLASDDDKQAAFSKGTRPKVRYLYKRRCAHDSGVCLLDIPAEKEKLAQQWGQWTLTDPKVKERPTEDYAKDFPNRDIPWDKFPSNAWQVDKEYLPNFLTESIDLVERALEGILAEYGRSKFDMPDKSFDERVKDSSFMVEVLKYLRDGENPYGGVGRKATKGNKNGGWYTSEYFDGLVRRIMHAVITEDTFTLIMGGHSASAGHGNHLRQSYTLQFFKVLEPVLARVGVKLLASNVGYGGLGTGQSSLGAGSIYGKEIDMYLWDSSMTENSNEAYDLFVRQGLLSGNRIPVLYGGMPDALARYCRENVTCEVGQWGDGEFGVPETIDAVQALSMPWAARYIRCGSEAHDVCRMNEYNGTCWIDRDDYTPETPQQAAPGGRASWHPGNRKHAIKGRIIAFPVLRALLEGLKQWNEAPDLKLPEEVWHVTEHYDSIRTGLAAVSLDPKDANRAFCAKLDLLPFPEFCSHPFQAVSEMTPRVNPRENAMRNLMQPAYDGYLPTPKESLYNPPDVFNPTLAVPVGEFDYLAVVENGIDYREFLAFDNHPLPAGKESTGNVIKVGIDNVKPGLGWGLDTQANPDECDGSYDGFCGRGPGNNCLLSGHNDRRGGLMFDSFSGWGIFTLPNVKLGKIAVRIEWWGNGLENVRTNDWTEVNNGDPEYNRRDLAEADNGVEYYEDESSQQSSSTNAQRSRRLGHPASGYINRTDHRMLGGGESLCDSFRFEMAVDGKITAYGKDKFQEKLIVFQRVVQIQVVPFDAASLKGEAKDVEVAFRIYGCEQKNLMKISHIYWA